MLLSPPPSGSVAHRGAPAVAEAAAPHGTTKQGVAGTALAGHAAIGDARRSSQVSLLPAGQSSHIPVNMPQLLNRGSHMAPTGAASMVQGSQQQQQHADHVSSAGPDNADQVGYDDRLLQPRVATTLMPQPSIPAATQDSTLLSAGDHPPILSYKYEYLRGVADSQHRDLVDLYARAISKQPPADSQSESVRNREDHDVVIVAPRGAVRFLRRDGVQRHQPS
jgi:hypothetical protein